MWYNLRITHRQKRLNNSPANVNLITIVYTLWVFNIARENGPFIDGLPN